MKTEEIKEVGIWSLGLALLIGAIIAGINHCDILSSELLGGLLLTFLLL